MSKYKMPQIIVSDSDSEEESESHSDTDVENNFTLEADIVPEENEANSHTDVEEEFALEPDITPEPEFSLESDIAPEPSEESGERTTDWVRYWRLTDADDIKLYKSFLDLLPPQVDWSLFLSQIAPIVQARPFLVDVVERLNEWKHKHRLNIASVRFALQSLMYMRARPKLLALIYEFTLTGYTAMNEQTEEMLLQPKKPVKQARYAEWLHYMTDPRLPRVPRDFLLVRCVYSTPSFDVLHADSVDSYRVSSTSSAEKGICIGSVGHEAEEKSHQTSVHMYMRFKDMRGLMLFTEEEEILLPPGLRFTWNKNALNVIPQDAVQDAKRAAGQFVEHDAASRMTVYYRLYDVDFIPSPHPTYFSQPNIAVRVARMRHGLAILRKALEKQRQHARANVTREGLENKIRHSMTAFRARLRTQR